MWPVLTGNDRFLPVTGNPRVPFGRQGASPEDFFLLKGLLRCARNDEVRWRRSVDLAAVERACASATAYVKTSAVEESYGDTRAADEGKMLKLV